MKKLLQQSHYFKDAVSITLINLTNNHEKNALMRREK